jgi:predicted transcriptional regulator
LGLNGGLPRGVDFFLVKSDRAARYFRLFIATNFKFSGPV